jgi:hypothetical protein
VKEPQFWLAIFTSKNAFLRLIMRSSDLQKNQVIGLFSGWQLDLDAISGKVASPHQKGVGSMPVLKYETFTGAVERIRSICRPKRLIRPIKFSTIELRH